MVVTYHLGHWNREDSEVSYSGGLLVFPIFFDCIVSYLVDKVEIRLMPVYWGHPSYTGSGASRLAPP